MKIFVTIILFLSFLFSNGQIKLYYISTADGRCVGVRDEKGTIIIPPIHEMHYDFDLTVPIDDPFIEFMGIVGKQKASNDSPAFAGSMVYDRKGNLLYQSQFFDNGPDYWSEGLRRYVVNDRIGFVDVLGNKITEAKWGFALPFNYGYATVYAGKMKKQYDAGGEHWIAVPAEDDVREYLINRNGVEVDPLYVQHDTKDYFYKGAYYPNPFQYTTKEKMLLDRLTPYRVAVAFLFKLGLQHYIYRPLQFEIVEKPNRYFPYYVIGVYEEQRRLDDYTILLDGKSGQFYISSWGSRTELLLLDHVLISSLEDNLLRGEDFILPATRKLAEQELLKLKN